MPPNLSKPNLNQVSVEQARLETTRTQDVVMLVDTLLRNEETTIGMIVDCLYDIGTARLIHQKVEPQILQDVTKPIARLSKPAARAFALRWVKKNCPVLLTNWLYSKVKFDQPKSPTKSAPQPSGLEEVAEQTLAENTAAPIANHPTQRQATSPLSQTPYPPDAAPPVEAALPNSLDAPDTAIAPTPQASAMPDATITASPETTVTGAADKVNTASDRTDTGIVPLSEYNRAIAQIKYRDNELRRLRAQVRIFMALVLGSAIAMGGLLLSFAPTTELSQPTVTGQSWGEE